MTQIGKCDICRQRKIKCDEIHPVCGGCRKKNRPCHYSYGKVSQYIEEGGIMMDGGKPLTIRRAQEGPARTKKPAADVTSKPASLEATENSASSLLRLRSSRQTQDGNGLFQTFAPLCKKADRPANAMTKVRSYIQSNGSHMPVQDDYNRVDPIMLLFMEPSNEATQRLDHWVHFTETLKDLYGIRWILGEWMELVPCRLGNAKSLDAAVDCFEKAVAYRNNKSTQNLALTASSNGTALRSIRTDILSGQHDLIANDVLLAICLLIFAEIFIRPGSGQYKYHQTGLLNLIMNISKNGAQCNDSIRYFIDCCCSWEAFPAISQNRDSLFDDPVWVNIEKPPLTAPGQPETEGSFDRMIHCMRMHWSTLPRLTRLVKAAAIMPEDMALRTEAAELAFELWSLDLDEVVQEFFDLGKITIAPTLTEECQPYLDHCLNFATYPVHVGLLNYWTVRTLLCGLILHLLDLFPVVPSSFLFDYDEVAAHDVQCARYLAMSIQYSCLERGPVPLDSIRHMAPMQVAFCSFDRLESRSGGRGSSTPEAEYSRRMKDLVMTVLKDRVSRLDSVTSSFNVIHHSSCACLPYWVLLYPSCPLAVPVLKGCNRKLR